MTPEEYAAKQAVISAAVAQFALSFAQFFTRPLLTPTEWVHLLGLLFPEIERRREQSAALAREFYDSQRELFHPELPRNDRPLEGSTFEKFVENMEPTREKMSLEDSPQDAVGSLALRSVREVENAGRQQIIHAVSNDERKQIVRGWARVATGRETCAWCLMLISRGPVYQSANTAGLDLDDPSAAEMFAAGEDVSDFMEQWHDGCDCKVVPVFDRADWPGRDAFKRAEDLWIKASSAARTEMDENPDRVHKAGKKKGKPFTLNETTINVLRQMLESGEIEMSEFAAFAA